MLRELFLVHGTYTWGETEDYLLNVSASSACTGTPTPGNTISTLAAPCTGINFTLTMASPTLGTGVSYQWQSSPDNSTWANIGGATNNALTTSHAAATYYRCEVTCSGSGQIASSNPLQVNLTSGIACLVYCASTASSAADEDIGNVTVGGINNTSACGVAAPGPGSVASFYSNFRTSVAPGNLVKGVNEPFSVSILQCNSGPYGNQFKIYIDYNQNGLFTDAGEEVADVTGAGAWTGTGSFLVPLTATDGVTVMRVVDVEGTVPGPCVTYTWGETEDYLVNIVPLPADPANPTQVNVPNCNTGGLLTSGGSAPSGETWYWQSSASGTSTALPATVDLPILSNGTYYVRSQDNTYFTWSAGAGSITVTNFPSGPADPTVSAPVTGNPACGAVTLVSSVATPGSTNYWQGTNATGTSTASIADDGTINNPYSVPADGIYYVRAQDNTSFCWSNAVATTVAIYTIPTTPILSATPSTICPGSPTILSAIAPSAPPTGYTVASTAFSPVSPLTTTLANAGPTGDEGTTIANIGFSFNYFGTVYTQVQVHTNGYIVFGRANYTFGSFSPALIPNAANTNNWVGFWADLNASSGQISYETQGIAPNRVFIVNYNNVPYYSATPYYAGQIIDYEATGAIDVFLGHTQTTNTGACGLENLTGSAGVAAPGRNSGSWATDNEGWKFSPIQAIGFLWTANGVGSGIAAGDEFLARLSASPSGTTTYTMTLTEPLHNCQSSNTVLVTVAPTPPQPTGTGAATVCGAGTVTLSATTTGGTLNWYDLPSGGTLLGSGLTLPVVVVASDVTVYVEEFNGTCSGPREAVTATYTVPPALTVSSDVSFVCIGGSNTGVGGPNNNTANLSASGPGYTFFTWTSTPSGFNAVGANVSAVPSATTVYTCTASGSGCTAVSTVSVTGGVVPVISSVSATPPTVCQGNTSQLVAAVAGGSGGAVPTYGCSPILFATNGCNYIATVSTTGGMTNFTNATNAYDGVGFTYFPASIVSQTLGGSFTLTCQTQGSCSIAYYNIWIDWTRDGDFDDLGENVVVANGVNSLNNVTSFVINIPVTASPGSTRIRVLANGNSINPVTACDNFSSNFSEVEDYVLDIQGGLGYSYAWTGAGLSNTGIFNPIATLGSPSETYSVLVTDPNGCYNSGSVTLTEPASNPGNTISTANPVCPTQSFTLSTQFTPPGANYQWQSSPDNATWTNVGTNSPTYTATQSAATWYRSNVGCTSGSNFTTALLVAQNAIFNCFCASAATQTIDEEIYSVTVNGGTTPPAYAGTNGCTTAAPGPGSLLGRYSNFVPTGNLTTVFQGATVPFTIVEDECDGAPYYAFGTAIWIDYNQNGSFADPGEQVFVEGATAIGPRNVVGSFVVPGNALSGVTLMRITIAEGISGAGLTPCLSYGYGETEDWLINIGDPNCIAVPTFPPADAQVCPDASFAVSWPAASGATGYNVYWGTTSTTLSLVSASQTGTTYMPTAGDLVNGQTGSYFWQVVPLYTSATCSTPQVWSFGFKVAPSPLASSNSPICSGASLSLFGSNLNPLQPSNSYSWTGPGGYNDVQQNPVINSTTVGNSGYYVVAVTNSFGCTLSDSTLVDIVPPPALSILSQTNVSCNGGNDGAYIIVVTNDPNPGSTFYNFDGVVDTAGFYTGVIAGTYTVQVTDGIGCLNSIQVVITEPDPTTLPLAGPDQTSCIGGTVTLAANAAVVGTGTWTVTAGAGTFANANNPATTVTGLASGLNTFSWTIVNALCSITNSDGVDVITNVLPTATLSGTTTICNGQNTNLTLVFTGTGPWTYSYSNGSTTFGPFTTSNSTENILVAPTVLTNYSLVGVDDVNCTGTTSGSASISVVNGIPSGSINTMSAPITACVGSIATVTCNSVPGAVYYSWSGPTGTLFNGQPGPFSTTIPSVSVEFGVLSTTSGYNICVTAGNACGTVNTRCFWVRGTVSIPAPITGNVVGCPNTTSPYSVPAVVGAANYFWTATPQMQVISGQGTPNVVIRFLAGFNTGSICVVAATSCGSSSTARCMTVSKATANPSAMSGPFAQCPGQTGQVFSVLPVAGAGTYTWTVPANITITNGLGTPSITTSVGSNFVIGNICVTATSICGIVSAPRCKTVNSIQPNTPGNIIGPAAGVCGQTYTYSIPSQSGISTYNWVVPAGATIVNGAGTTSIDVLYPSNFTTGQLCVTAVNGCGSSVARCMNIKGVPSDLGVINGPSTVCSFDASVLYFITPVFGATSYLWTIPAGASFVAGQGSNAIIMDYGIGGGQITVKAINACGQSGTRILNILVNCRVAGELPGTKLNAYPNPVSTNLNIDLDATVSGAYTLELMDVSGRIVKSEVMNAIAGMNSNNIDVRDLSKGMYMLRVQNVSGFTQQIMIAVE
ncbi:MAG: T9SS type A sorting domain-containing protein [Bacteroidetes bacterium]|nr:T9SS type A sorting domain-containing protein [Bacteroidota bacterium]